jgi:hypothetical protein
VRIVDVLLRVSLNSGTSNILSCRGAVEIFLSEGRSRLCGKLRTEYSSEFYLEQIAALLNLYSMRRAVPGPYRDRFMSYVGNLFCKLIFLWETNKIRLSVVFATRDPAKWIGAMLVEAFRVMYLGSGGWMAAAGDRGRVCTRVQTSAG